MIKSNEQKLVDICFQIAIMINDKTYRKQFDKMDTEQTVEWVSSQLEQCGFPTTPIDCSWGVLNSSLNKNQSTNFTIVEANRL